MAKKKVGPTQQPQASISKMAAIKQVLAKGLESPVEIVKQEFGLDGQEAARSQWLGHGPLE